MLDVHLPFSLHHSREDQYRFFGNEGNSSTSTLNESTHHDQVFLDAACDGPIPLELNVTPCEVREALYNERLISDLLRIGISNEHCLFYSAVVAQHNIRPVTGTADGVRAALIQHLFSGECLVRGGPQCKDVVCGEQWPQQVGIKVIDLVIRWVDSNQLSTKDLRYICASLDLPASNTNQRRSLLSKLMTQTTSHQRDGCQRAHA